MKRSPEDAAPDAAGSATPNGEASTSPGSRSAGIFAIFARESQGHAAALLAALEAGEEPDALLALAHAELDRWRRDACLLRLGVLVSALLALQQRVQGWQGRFAPTEQGQRLRRWVTRLRELSDELACKKPSPRALRAAAELVDEIEGSEPVGEVEAKELAAAEPTPHASGRRILIFDDSPVIGEVILEELRARGHAVALVRSVSAFEERMCAFVPDVLLLDVNMPEVSGDALCRRVRGSYPPGSILVLLFSSIPPDELSRIAAAAGADGFVSKHQRVGAMVRDLEQHIAS